MEDFRSLAARAAAEMIESEDLAEVLAVDREAYRRDFGGNLPIDGWLEGLIPQAHHMTAARAIVGRDLTAEERDELDELFRAEVARLLSLR